MVDVLGPSEAVDVCTTLGDVDKKIKIALNQVSFLSSPQTALESLDSTP